MPVTLKSIISTAFYICTIATAGFLCILGIGIYLCNIDPLDTSLQIPHDQLQQLNESYNSLNEKIVYHQTHVTGPFTEALIDQMVAVKDQVSDLAADLGCAEQEHMKNVCYTLMLEELRLRFDIVTKRMEAFLDVEEKVVERYIEAEKEEMERYVDTEKEKVDWELFLNNSMERVQALERPW